jgi:hypothetical protein
LVDQGGGVVGEEPVGASDEFEVVVEVITGLGFGHAYCTTSWAALASEKRG